MMMMSFSLFFSLFLCGVVDSPLFTSSSAKQHKKFALLSPYYLRAAGTLFASTHTHTHTHRERERERALTMPPQSKKKKRAPASAAASAAEEKKKKKTKSKTAPKSTKAANSGEDSESNEEEEDDEEDEDESDVDGEDDDDTFIDVEIEFVTPKEEHFLNLKSYLTAYCDRSQYNVSELVDMILKQDDVGSVIASRVSAEEEEDPLGVMTVISLDKAKEFKCLQEIKAHIVKKAPKEEAKLVRDALNAKKTGLILSERLVNVPQDIGGPLIKQLFDEIKWAVKDEKKKEFDFDQYVLVSRCFLDTFTPPPSVAGGGKKNNNKKRKKGEKEEEVTELVFPNLEDEIFYEESQWSFMWEAGGEDKPQEFEDSKPMRMCMLIDAKDVGTICEDVQEMFLALSVENAED